MDTTYIVNKTVTRAFEDDIDITQAHLEEVIREHTLTKPKGLRFYQDIKVEMETSLKDNARRPIRFKLGQIKEVLKFRSI